MNRNSRILSFVAVSGVLVTLPGSMQAAQPTPSPDRLHFINTAFENASPLQWHQEANGTIQVHLLYDYERNAPNRAAGHWHFELQGAPGSAFTLVLNNFSNIYNGRLGSPISRKSICYLSPDGRRWRPVPMEYLEDNRLQLQVTMEGPSLFLARLEPYRLSDLDRLLEDIRRHRLVEITSIGNTVQGRPLEIIRIGNPAAPQRVFLRARSHAWEPGGNWVVEGLVRSLLSGDETARQCLKRYCVYIMPMANKDGVAAGLTRFNLLGKDLNRDWGREADAGLAPENHALEGWLKERIAAGRGPQLAIDLHNDESGRLHVARPAVPNVARHVERMQRLESLLRAHTWFREGAYLAPEGQNSGTLGAGLLERLGIDACILELNSNWVAGLNQPPSAQAWQDFGKGLRRVFYDYFEPTTRQ